MTRWDEEMNEIDVEIQTSSKLKELIKSKDLIKPLTCLMTYLKT